MDIVSLAVMWGEGGLNLSSIITPVVSANEGDRIKRLESALVGDKRFQPLQVSSDLPVDLRFECAGRCLNVELKLPSDLVQSIMGGHLYEQTLSIREACEDGCIVVLGDLDSIYKALRDSATGRGIKKSEISRVVASTHARYNSFKKRSLLNGIPMFYRGDDSGFFDGPDQWKDILELAADYMSWGNMLGFRQKPAHGERELAAASMLFHGDGIGPGVLRPVLEQYALRLVPRTKDATPIKGLPGIGAKRSAIIERVVIR